MTNYIVTDSQMISLADAIREKGGTSEFLTFPNGMISAISDISTGGGDVDVLGKYLNKTLVSIHDNTIGYIGGSGYGYPTFMYQYSLEEAELPNASYMYESAFFYCSSLKRLYTPNLSYLSSYNYSTIFYLCSQLSDWTVHPWYMGTSQGAGYMPSPITNGSYIRLNGNSTYMLNNISSRTTNLIDNNCITLRQYLGSNAKASLTYVALGNVKAIGHYAFSGCNNLTYISTPALEYLGGTALRGCGIYSFDCSTVYSTGNYCFSSCTNLSLVSMPLISVITSGLFTGCTNLSNLTLSSTITAIYGGGLSDCLLLQNWFENLDKTHISIIQNYALAGMSITSLNLPNAEYVGMQGLSLLESISIPNCKSLQVGAFMSTALTTFIHSSIDRMEYSTFKDCKSLSYVSIGYVSFISGINTRCYMFWGCDNLEYVSMGGPINGSPGELCFWFTYTSSETCSKLREIHLPDMTFLNFGYNWSEWTLPELSILDIPMVNAGSGQLRNLYPKLKSLSLPAVSTISNYNYISGIFKSCGTIEEIYLPNLEIFYSGLMFTDCSSLKILKMGDTASSGITQTNIQVSTFSGCHSLESLIINLTTNSYATLSANAFDDTPIGNDTFLGYYGSIYVPSSIVSQLQSRANWSKYSDRITSIVE